MRGLSEALRFLRIFHDMGQNELGLALDISASYLSQLESGKKMPTIEAVSKYSNLFEIPVSSIMLLAERLERHDFSYGGVESLVSAKVLRILGWLEEKQKSTQSTSAEGRVSLKKGAGREDKSRTKQRVRAS